MKHCISFVIFFLSFLSVIWAREKYNFNSDWKVHVGDPDDAETPGFDDSDWKDVTTPYAWNEDEAFHQDIHNMLVLSEKELHVSGCFHYGPGDFSLAIRGLCRNDQLI